MFKKTQKYLLLKYPLLWNTKAIPLIALLLIFHLIFFIVGYINGAINFTETSRNYFTQHDTVVFFGILISILTLIICLVFYFKNNSFKALYPKTNFALFKEWLLIVLICFLVTAFSVSYFSGVESRIRSYYTENEAKKRCELLSKASIFYGSHFDTPEEVDSVINDTSRLVRLEHVNFKGKKYSLNSLINKDINSYSFFDSKWDSVTKIKVKTWLINSQQDSVKNVLSGCFALLKEHRLKSNIDADKWFELIYNAPDFKQTRVIAKREKDYYNNGNYDYDYESDHIETISADGTGKTKIDTLNETLKYIGKEEYVFYKTYISADELEYNYEKIANTYTNPDVSPKMLLAFIYLAMGLSVVLFSFRVTSGRSWLISLIGMGIINIILGILTIMFNLDYFYFIALLLLTLVLFGYLVFVNIRGKAKGISGITLNASLWLLPAFIPIVYQLLLEFLRHVYGYYDYYSYNYTEGFDYDKYPLLKFIKDNGENMLWFNLAFIVLVMCFYSIQIKKWKSLAES